MIDQDFSHQYTNVALHSYRIEESCTGSYFGLSKMLDKQYYLKLQAAFQSMKEDGAFDKLHLDWVGLKPAF
jgi:hypothetical protein